MSPEAPRPAQVVYFKRSRGVEVRSKPPEVHGEGQPGPGELAAQLFARLRQAPRDVAYLFLDELSLRALTLGDERRFRSLLFGHSDEALFLERARKAPATNLLSSRGGGFIGVGGDVFPEGYFRKQRKEAAKTAEVLRDGRIDPELADALARCPPPTRALVRHQPWLEWHPRSRRFRLRQEGAQVAMLARLPETVRLFRGAGRVEAGFYLALNQLRAGTSVENHQSVCTTIHAAFEGDDPSLLSLVGTVPLQPEVGGALAGVLLEVYLARQADLGRDAIFWTTDRGAAVRWASPMVLQTSVARSVLDAWSARGELFVGFESDYDHYATTGAAALGEVLGQVSATPVTRLGDCG